MTTLNVNIPTTDNATVAVDLDKLPRAVATRLMEMALSGYVRSIVTSAFSNELSKAKREHDAAQAAAKEADKKHKVVEFDAENFTSKVDPVALANEKVNDLYEGNIRAARGKSGENRALISLVTSNVISALKAKGKKHKEAAAMINGDPFGFIERSARKRAGDDVEAYKVEIAKLNALYVDPARAILGSGPSSNASDGEGEEADDLI